MRVSSVLAFTICALCCGLVAAEEFPFTGYIVTDDVYIRSGPGKNYYPTDKLPKGEAVDIYRIDPGGWYAIRPPRRSFSWVSGRQVKLLDSKLAEVIEDGTVARVGSMFSDVRDVIQVRLDKGEQVEIVETARGANASESQTWYKIAPPAGEFRWVFGKFVDREPTDVGVSRTPLAKHARDENEVKPDPDAAPVRVSSTRDADSDHVDDSGDRRLGEPIRQVAGSRQGRNRAVLEDAVPPRSQWRGELSGTTAAPEKLALGPRSTKSSVPTSSFEAEIDKLEMDLSVMAAEEPTVWNFDSLQHRAEDALERASTAIERGRARLVLNKIERFESIKLRFETVSKVQDETDQQNWRLEKVGENNQAEHEKIKISQELASYDGTGKLVPVVSRRTGAPSYALVDAQGEIRSFVTPAPGVSLQKYQNQQIGVSGQRGFMPELNKPHVTAQRVTVLR